MKIETKFDVGDKLFRVDFCIYGSHKCEKCNHIPDGYKVVSFYVSRITINNTYPPIVYTQLGEHDDLDQDAYEKDLFTTEKEAQVFADKCNKARKESMSKRSKRFRLVEIKDGEEEWI